MPPYVAVTWVRTVVAPAVTLKEISLPRLGDGGSATALGAERATLLA